MAPTTLTSDNTGVVILAGGENRRMGGQAKIFLPLGESSLLQHTLACIHGCTGRVALSYNDQPPSALQQNLPVIKDQSCERQGPLAGLISGLIWLKENHASCQWLITLPGDTPFLPTDLVQQFCSAANAEQETVHYIQWQQRNHYLTAIWPVNSLATLQSYFDSGKRSAKGLLKQLKAKPLILTEQEVEAPSKLIPHLFLNINTPEDYQNAKNTFKGLSSK
ncbi:molybdenum cofactor guanylyltransferase [Teredinibacter haidensis]|uniref:molybdenum cofactor guanylyltransferase n=1 Tax=Teredinibacter haidensis TaxID=2731755 RepID=UPI000948D09F|nr:molybdenum cofactor guanylyltransferase [Teredinibacter haidensis]